MNLPPSQIIEKNALLQGVLDSSLDMIQVFEAVRDKSGQIVDFKWILINQTSEKIFGNVVGKSLLAENPGVKKEGIFQTFCQVVETDVPSQRETHYVHEQFNGWFYQSAVKLNDGVATTTTDITKLKNAQEEILRLKDEIAQRTEDKYQTLFSSIDEAVAVNEMIFDDAGKAIDFRILEVNKVYERQTGLREESVVGKLQSEVLPNIERHWIEGYAQVALTGIPWRTEYFSSDVQRWYKAFVSRIGDEKSRQIAVVFDDITERKKTEISLQENEQRKTFLLTLSDALRPLKDAVAIRYKAVEVLGQFISANRVAYAENIDGEFYEVKQNYTDGLPKVVGRFRYNEFGSDIVSMLQNGQNRVQPDIVNDKTLNDDEKEALAAYGVAASLNVPLVKNGQLVAFIGINFKQAHEFSPQEIALVEETAERTWAAIERAKAETALRTSQANLSALFDATPIGIAFIDLNGKVILSNNEMKRFLPTGRIPSSGDRQQNWIGFYQDGSIVEAENYPGARAIRGEPAIPGIQFIYKEDDGNEIWTEVAYFPVKDNNGNVTHLVCAITNVDALKRTAEAFRISEQQLKNFNNNLETLVAERTEELRKQIQFSNSITETFPDMISIMEYPSLKVQYMNRDIFHEHDFDPDELQKFTGEQRKATIHPEDYNTLVEYFKGFENLEQNGVITAEYRALNNGGKWIWYRTRGKVFEQNENGTPKSIINIIQNIMALKEAESSLINAEKLETAYSFARTIAHEVRNPLTTVNLSIAMLKAEAKTLDNQSIENYVNTIERNSRRIDHLITQLLFSSRPSNVNFEHIKVSTILELALEQVQDRILINGAKVMREYAADSVINIDIESVKIALLSIIINAIEAMPPNEGILTIRTRQAENECIIAIQDNGYGISKEIRSRIFDPFYTTKVDGMGLGLANTMNIIKINKGKIDVKSQEEVGTTFIISLPIYSVD